MTDHAGDDRTGHGWPGRTSRRASEHPRHSHACPHQSERRHLWRLILAAASLAAVHAAGRVVTVSVEAMTFLHPVAVGDEVSVYAELISVGRSSMKISVEA